MSSFFKERVTTVPDDRKKPTDAEKNGDDGFRVDVPDDLLEEAVSAVDARAAASKNQVNTGGDDDDMPAELSVDMEASATEAEAAPDIEKMTVDELLNSGFLPDKIVSAFLDERNKAGEVRRAADFTRNKLDAYLAEADVFRKRLTREKDDALKFASEKVIKEFLPVIDNLERALAHAGDSQAGSIKEGVEITLRQANQVLEKLGVTRVNTAIGTPFDPHFHEAVTHKENKDIPVNSIAMVMQAGFLLHDRLLRPAMVAVATGGSPEKMVSAPVAAAAPATAKAAPAAAPAASGAETPEQRLERIRRAGQAARDQRLKKREEEEAKAKAAAPAQPKETPDEKLERIRKTGQAAREARMARKKEQARAREAKAGSAKPEATSGETPEQKLERIRKTGQAAREAREAKRRERDRGDAQSIAAAEQKAAREAKSGETPEQKLERIRKTGEAAREARRKKREADEAKETSSAAALEEDEAVAEAEAGEAKSAPTKTETPDEKLARIRKTGLAAREARRKAKEAGSARPAANPLAGPAFEDDDLDGWETTVDLIRTDKNQS